MCGHSRILSSCWLTHGLCAREPQPYRGEGRHQSREAFEIEQLVQRCCTDCLNSSAAFCIAAVHCRTANPRRSANPLTVAG